MANLVELYDLVIQAQALNGVPLSHGHVYVYALGRTKLMDTWSNIDGESLNPNPVILDNAGQAHIYVSDDFDYTLVFTDEFDNEIFSVDKYLLSKGEHSHADVAVAPSEHIGVSSYHVGEVTVYVPYLTGEVGKVYEGIDPIVVNNDVNRISANHIPLGVQDPLYFVEDSETACIIGCSAQTEIPTELSGKWDEASDAVIANSAQWAEGTEYEAGTYIDITNNTISVVNLPTSADVQNIVDVATSGLMPSGDYLTKESADTLYAPTGNYLTGLPDDLVYTADITGLATTAQLDEKLDKSDSGNFYPMNSNPSGYITAHQSLQGYATEQWVEDKGYLTGVDIPESATWNATTQTVSANSAQWAGGTANPQIPVTSTSGISIFESGDKVYFNVSADYALADDLTGKQDSLTFGYKDTAISSIDNSALYDNSAHARITTLAGRISDLSSNKLDTTAFSDVSSKYLPMATSGLSASGTYLIDAISNNRILGINTSGISANPNGGVTSVQVGGYNSPEIKIQGYFGTMELNSAGAQYLSSDNSVVWKVGDADHLWNFGGTNPPIVISPTPSAQSAYAPHLVANYQGITADFTNAPSAIFDFGKGIIYQISTAASGTWRLQDSVQKREIECDTATSAITAIAGSAIGGGVPAGTMNESAFGYDENDKISGYNGSAFKAGDEFPQSATDAIGYVTATSANIDSTINNVSANSGIWGGSALPISAGPGIKFEMVNDTLVASTDETVLWENNGTLYAVGQTINFNESPSAFEKLEFRCGVDIQSPECLQFEYNPGNLALSWHEFFNNQFRQWYTLLNVQDDGATAVSGQVYFANLDPNSTFTAYNQGPNWEYNFRGIQKIIGINRIAGE